MTFTVTVRDHMMVAHSLTGAVFGPAQQLHGATFVVDASFEADRLNGDGIVVDIGLASGALHDVVGAFSYHNLDDLPELSGINTTTEQLCRVIADRLADRASAGGLGDAGLLLTSIAITLHESPLAWASYRRAL